MVQNLTSEPAAAESTRAAIRTFIEETFIFGQDASQLHEDESLLEAGVIDSTGVLELIAFLEESYDIRVKDDEVIPENLDSISQIANYILRKTS